MKADDEVKGDRKVAGNGPGNGSGMKPGNSSGRG